MTKWVPVTESIAPWLNLDPVRIALIIVGLLLLFRSRIESIWRRCGPRVTITWGDSTPSIHGEAVAAGAAILPDAETSALSAPPPAAPPFRVGFVPDFKDEILTSPVPVGGSEPMRTEVIDIGILVAYVGAVSAQDVSYFYMFDPSAEGHPGDDEGEEGAPEYTRHPVSNRLTVVFKRGHQHPGTVEHHTLRVSFPFEQRCQEVLVSISRRDHLPFQAQLHLLVRAGFPHRIHTEEELNGWRCRLGRV